LNPYAAKRYAVALVALAVLHPQTIAAQAHPDRSVRLVVAFSAGGRLDTLARIIAQKLGEAWGQSVVTEKRPGRRQHRRRGRRAGGARRLYAPFRRQSLAGRDRQMGRHRQTGRDDEAMTL
jgi:hypothetical protein